MHVLIPFREQCQHDGSAKLGEDGTSAGLIHSRIFYLFYFDGWEIRVSQGDGKEDSSAFPPGTLEFLS
jgi:hypothetical protein